MTGARIVSGPERQKQLKVVSGSDVAYHIWDLFNTFSALLEVFLFARWGHGLPLL